jgi:hypothetical protein
VIVNRRRIVDKGCLTEVFTISDGALYSPLKFIRHFQELSRVLNKIQSVKVPSTVFLKYGIE